jgi:CDP-diacylglycerol--glycerol-3-phosphate 3-phosphatidyltransferase
MDDNTSVGHSRFDIDNLPNRLTLFRILLIPLIIGCFWLIHAEIFKSWLTGLEWIAAVTFTIAAITDFVDGHIARKKNIITIFGSFLDPIADKFLIVSSLIMLEGVNRVNFIIVAILVLREIYMTSLRLLATTEGISVPVNALGKWKTATQMIGIPILMITSRPLGIHMQLIGTLFIYVASVLSVYSSFHYSMGLLKRFKQLRIEKKIAKKLS